MRIRKWLVRPILKELRYLMTTVQEIKDGLAKVLAETTANTDTLDSALTFIAGINANVSSLQQQVADLQAQVAAGSPVTQADLDGIGAALGAVSDATDAQTAKEAIVTNAVNPPAAPAPADAPAQADPATQQTE